MADDKVGEVPLEARVHTHMRRNYRGYNTRQKAAQQNDDIELVPQPMKAREHRGGFEESMATMTVIQNTWNSIIEWACKLRPDIDPEIVRANITVDTVFSNDIRNGWAWTRTVSVVGYGVVGYVDWKTPNLKRKDAT